MDYSDRSDMSTIEVNEFKKQVIQMFRGERGPEFWKCFKDMSLRDASRICYIPIATFKRIRYETKDLEWDFSKMKAGYQMNRWQEIRRFREEIMKDNDFKQFKDLLRHAARYGAAMQKICVPKASEIEAMSLFEKGAREAAELQQRIKCRPVAASAPIPVNFCYPQPNNRTWSVFTSLNQQERAHALHLREQRLAALTREAMQIVSSLPLPVPITVPAPLGFIPAPMPVTAPAPLGFIIPAPVPIAAPAPLGFIIPAPVMLPSRKNEEKPQRCIAETQACANTALEAMKDRSLWRDATPREINAGAPRPLQYHEGTQTRACQLCSWMLLQSMVFDDSSRYIKAVELRWLLQRARSYTRTPEWAYDMEARRFAFLVAESMQLDPELAALPDLEPITDWGWLLTTGLAPQL
jgi:hypothetical protein